MSEKDFIDREHQLPADLADGVPDLEVSAGLGADMRAAPAGEPPADYDVRSVYDSRPVLGYDFNVLLSTSDIAGDPSPPLTLTSQFIVPQGFVAVVRKAHVWIEPNVPLSSRSNVLFTLAINGVRVQYNEDIAVGDETLEPLEFFTIIDELNSLAAMITLSGIISTNVFVHFYGNLLSKTGRPPAFEIANPVGRARVSRSVALQMPDMTPPARENQPTIAPSTIPAASPIPTTSAPAQLPKVDICRGLTAKGRASLSPIEVQAWQAQWAAMSNVQRNDALLRCTIGAGPAGNFIVNRIRQR